MENGIIDEIQKIVKFNTEIFDEYFKENNNINIENNLIKEGEIGFEKIEKIDWVNLECIINQMDKFHNIEIIDKVLKTSYFFENFYNKHLSSLNIGEFLSDEECNDIFKKGLELLNSGKQVVLHNNFSNGIFYKDNEIYINNFGLVGSGNSAFDAASIIAFHDLSIDKIIYIFEKMNLDCEFDDLFTLVNFTRIFWSKFWMLNKANLEKANKMLARVKESYELCSELIIENENVRIITYDEFTYKKFKSENNLIENIKNELFGNRIFNRKILGIDYGVIEFKKSNLIKIDKNDISLIDLSKLIKEYWMYGKYNSHKIKKEFTNQMLNEIINSGDLVYSHGSISPDNIVFSKESKQIELINFECSGISNYNLDISMAIVNFNFNSEQKNEFIKFFDKADTKIIEKIIENFEN